MAFLDIDRIKLRLCLETIETPMPMGTAELKEIAQSLVDEIEELQDSVQAQELLFRAYSLQLAKFLKKIRSLGGDVKEID